MYALRKCSVHKSIIKFIRLYSLARQNHYEVLKLRKNCTDKEIKEAFIKMSKQYHPDKNKDSKAQEKFVRIVEAYNVLGKTSSRARYDNQTEIPTSTSYSPYSYVYRPSPFTCRNGDYNYYQSPKNKSYYNESTKNTSTDEETEPNKGYYGFAGIKKVPNIYLVGLCFGIALFGVTLQVFVIRNSYMNQRKQAQERSKHLVDELERVRATARHNSNEMQTQVLLDRIVANANPTVATASLGQALAEDKKDNEDDILSEFGIGDSPEGWYNTHDDKVNLFELIRKILNYIEMPK